MVDYHYHFYHQGRSRGETSCPVTPQLDRQSWTMGQPGKNSVLLAGEEPSGAPAGRVPPLEVKDSPFLPPRDQ